MVVALIAISCKKEHIPSPIPTPPTPPTKPVYIMHKVDSLAMVDIYNKANGTVNLPGWNLEDWETWGGVTAVIVSGTNTIRVTGINIGYSHQGTLSEKVGELEWLQKFSVGGSGLHGTIPESICNLMHLQWIDIVNSNLTGTIPDKLFSSKFLYSVIIGNNPTLTGSIPSSIQNLGDGRFVYNINLSKNSLTGAIPKLPRMMRSEMHMETTLFVEYNNLTEIPFEYLTDETLLSISARMNRFSGELPQNIVDAIEQEPKGYPAIRYHNIFFGEFQEGYGFTNAPKVNP